MNGKLQGPNLGGGSEGKAPANSANSASCNIRKGPKTNREARHFLCSFTATLTLILLHPSSFTRFVLAVRTDCIQKGVEGSYTQYLQNWITKHTHTDRDNYT